MSTPSSSFASRWLRGALGLIASALVACSAAEDPPDVACLPSAIDPAADTSSTAPLTVRHNEPYRWVEADYESARRADPLQLVSKGPLPDDHAAVVWLQAFVDAADAVVRARVERELGAPLRAPKPHVRIVESGRVSLNGWASPVAVTLQNANDGRPTYAARFDGTGAPELGLALLERHPVARPASWNDRGDIARFLARSARLSNVAEHEGRFWFPCEEARASDGLVIYAMSPNIHVTVPLLKRLDEAGVFFLLAHELSHYYRAHATSADTLPYYWYEDLTAATWEPTPSPRATEPEEAYLAAERKSPAGVDPDLYARARRNEIGVSTIEMQADRLAVVILARLGISPMDAIEGIGQLHRAFDSAGSREYPPPEDCFPDLPLEGADLDRFRPIFWFAKKGAHPTFCYRRFDALRQARRHPPEMGPRLPMPGPWAAVKQALP